MDIAILLGFLAIICFVLYGSSRGLTKPSQASRRARMAELDWFYTNGNPRFLANGDPNPDYDENKSLECEWPNCNCPESAKDNCYKGL